MRFAILEHSKTSHARSELVEKKNRIGIGPTHPIRPQDNSCSHSAKNAEHYQPFSLLLQQEQDETTLLSK